MACVISIDFHLTIYSSFENENLLTATNIQIHLSVREDGVRHGEQKSDDPETNLITPQNFEFEWSTNTIHPTITSNH